MIRLYNEALGEYVHIGATVNQRDLWPLPKNHLYLYYRNFEMVALGYPVVASPISENHTWATCFVAVKDIMVCVDDFFLLEEEDNKENPLRLFNMLYPNIELPKAGVLETCFANHPSLQLVKV